MTRHINHMERLLRRAVIKAGGRPSAPTSRRIKAVHLYEVVLPIGAEVLAAPLDMDDENSDNVPPLRTTEREEVVYYFHVIPAPLRWNDNGETVRPRIVTPDVHGPFTSWDEMTEAIKAEAGSYMIATSEHHDFRDNPKGWELFLL